MKNFIEIINTEKEKLLVNINNIVKVEEITEDTLKNVNKLGKASKDLELIDNLLGTHSKETLIDSINKTNEANAIIYLNGAWVSEESSATIYTKETYDEIYKKIGEALI